MTTDKPQILRLPDVIKATGLSRSSIYGLIQREKFPGPIKLSERASGWPADEVYDWIQNRVNESRQNKNERAVS